MRVRTDILLLLSLVIIAGCNKQKKQVLLTSPTWKFSIRFPIEPEEKSGTRAIPGLGERPGVEYSCYYRDISFSVNVLDVQAGTGEREEVIQDRTYSIMEKTMPALGAEVRQSQTVVLNGLRCREIKANVAELKNAQLWTRIYVVGTRLYQIVVIRPSSLRDTDKLVTQFLDSFQVLK
jgi:hypothetical protein